MARKRSRTKHRKGTVAGMAGTSRPWVRRHGSAFTLGAHSPWKGSVHRVNPVLASYLNPHHKRHRGRSRYRHNPPVTALYAHPVQTIIPALVSTVSMAGVVTAGNLALSYLPAGVPQGNDAVSILIRAVVRGGIAYGGDIGMRSFLPKYVGSYRLGALIGIVGSAALDFFTKSFVLGFGDTAVYPQELLGLSGYFRYALKGAGNAGAYIPSPLRGVGDDFQGVGSANGGLKGSNAYQRVYGV